MVAWVAALYVLIQLLESYVLTPLLQSRAIALPPLVIIACQLALGTLFGLLGVVLATPIAAVVAAIASEDHNNTATGARPR